MADRFDGLVIAGGSSRRMGGGDKTALTVGGRSMRAIAVDALADAAKVLLVGPDGDLVEDPPGGGPLAALAAGLAQLSAPVVAVIAADLPFVTRGAVATLVDQAPAVAVDDSGRAQYLLAAYRTDDLRAVMPADPSGRSLRSVVDLLAPTMLDLPGTPPPWWDCDTPGALDQAREWG
ncbi:MAG TPA: NTP transferase domain-containing protein [Mycobacteriales bacterium]|nr:NTP transferase domain-containing protein [Mycobacteriales bacterium]